MIEAIMYFGIGFLVAALSFLVVVPLVHGRAVRLTKRRLEGEIPSSMAEIVAEKDLQRAEFAMSTRRLEMKVEELKTKNSSQFAELGRKDDLINRLKIELGALRDQFLATPEEWAVKATAVHQAERALSDGLDEPSTVADAQKIQIIAFETQIESLNYALDRANNEFKAMEESRDAERIELKAATKKLLQELGEAERALCDKESKLTKLMGELDERSTLADAQKSEIVRLETQVEALNEGLDRANNELQAMEESRDAERIELRAATKKLLQERGKFENFQLRVAELVKQVVAQTTDDKIHAEDLENRLVEQSRLLNESESELKHLRSEIEIARQVESDLLNAAIEIDVRANNATQNLMAEMAKLQAALDRANGERVRLAHELDKFKRQAEETWAA
jgi:chromosome segregation ATPase